ncbi:MAG: AmmeMemoRadiSam system protein A [Bacteroidota bacterium]|nr:AmmeMemoRadiSam system protein A [Bacteroidota bacterium]
MLSTNDKKILLETARKSIEAAIEGNKFESPRSVSSALKESCGAFVTLHKYGELRGCIGYIEGVLPLIETVKDVAAKAATEDYRFNPVTQDEMPEIDIEISVLTPLRLIKDINEIEVGKHGIVMQREHNRGLLLPQVATEYGWDRETFLNQTAHKAGLSADAWKKPDTNIYIFSAEIFGEEKNR